MSRHGMYMWPVLTKWVTCQQSWSLLMHSHSYSAHARGRKLQNEKIAFEVRGHASTWSRALSFHIQLFCFYFTICSIINTLPSHAHCRRYVWEVVYCDCRNIIWELSNVSQRRPVRCHVVYGKRVSFMPTRGLWGVSRNWWRLFTDGALS